MQFKKFIAPVFVLLLGASAFAQKAIYTTVADNRTNGKTSDKNSKYVVTVEEAAELRLEAAKDISQGWRKIEWKEAGISLAVPEEFKFVAHRDDRKTADWQARRWQSRLPQPNMTGYKVWIAVQEYKTQGKKTPAELLNAEEEFLNVTDGSDVSDLPPITRLKLNGVEGVISQWDVPKDVQFTWTAFRIYKGKLQKIKVEVSGREEVLTGVREILQSIKIRRD